MESKGKEGNRSETSRRGRRELREGRGVQVEGTGVERGRKRRRKYKTRGSPCITPFPVYLDDPF